MSYNPRLGDQFLEQPNRATGPAGPLPGKHEAHGRKAAGDPLRAQDDERGVRPLGRARQARPSVIAEPTGQLHPQIQSDHGEPARLQEQLRTAQGLDGRERANPEQAVENHPGPPDGFRVQRVGKVHARHHLSMSGGGGEQRDPKRRLARRKRAAQLAHPPARQPTAERGVQCWDSRLESANHLGGGGPEPNGSW